MKSFLKVCNIFEVCCHIRCFYTDSHVKLMTISILSQTEVPVTCHKVVMFVMVAQSVRAFALHEEGRYDFRIWAVAILIRIKHTAKV